MRDIRFVYAEGLAMGDGRRQQSIDLAGQAMERIAA